MFLCILVASAAAAPSVSELIARPSHFTPNGDGVSDSTEVSFRPSGDDSTVTVEVLVFETAGGTQVASLLAPTMVASDTLLTVVWAPGTTPDGDYRIDVNVTDPPDSITESVTVTVDTGVPSVAFGTIGPNPFAPNLDPPLDELDVILTVPDADATTYVTALSEGTVVATIGTFLGAGSDTLHWNGDDDSGSPAPTGDYEIRAVASDLAGNADTVAVDVVLDRDSPVFTHDDGTSLQTDAFPITLSGSVTDADRVTSVTWEFLDSGETAVDSLSAAGPSVTWQTDIPFASPVAGNYEVVLRALDAVGYETLDTIAVAYDTVFPSAVSTTVLSGTTVQDGDVVQIRTTWNLAGLDVSADFGDVDVTYLPSDVDVSEESPAVYRIDYRVSPSNTFSSGPKDIVITGAGPFLSGETTVTVQLVSTSIPTDPGFAINANRFDPEAGESVTIAARSSGTPVEVKVFDLSGRLIRNLVGTGFVDWDGRGESGQTASSGVYFLQILVDEVEHKGKVAVLRGGGS